MRLPSKGGGTLNPGDDCGVSSSGTLGGRGGGGGPGLVWLAALLRPGNGVFALVPAFSRGGGTRYRGLCGDDSPGGLGLGLGGFCTAGAPAFLLDGGGAGGGPLPVLPVCCGLTLAASATGGGGGGARAALSCCSV